MNVCNWTWNNGDFPLLPFLEGRHRRLPSRALLLIGRRAEQHVQLDHSLYFSYSGIGIILVCIMELFIVDYQLSCILDYYTLQPRSLFWFVWRGSLRRFLTTHSCVHLVVKRDPQGAQVAWRQPWAKLFRFVDCRIIIIYVIHHYTFMAFILKPDLNVTNCSKAPWD